MGATKARFGVVIIFCSLLIAISIKGWLSYARLTDRIYASIQQQTGFALNAGHVQYDPVNQKISLKNVTINAPGLDVETASMQFGIVAPGWRDIGRQTFPVNVEYARFANTSIKVDSPESLLPLFDLGNAFFHQGVISLGQNSSGFSFSSLDFHHQANGNVGINATGANGLSWAFDGVVDDGNKGISGKLVFEQQDIARFLSDAGYSGHFNAVFDLEWTASKPLQLSGALHGDTGSYQSGSFIFSWEGWHLPGVELSDWKIADTPNTLAVDKARLELLNSSILPFLNWSDVHPFKLAGLNITSIQVKPDPERADQFDFADARLSLKDQKGDYHFAAKLTSGGQLSLTGSTARGYRLALENIVPASLDLLETTQHHNLANRRYNFSYNSQNGVARLSFWRQKAIENYSLLERMLFNANGLAELTFVDESIRLSELKATVGRQISAGLKAIEDMPFTYLSRLSDEPFQPYFEHIPGNPGLSQDGEANLLTLKKICELRPGLNWQLETSFSDTDDWPEIARNELEQTLANLSPNGNSRPEKETREMLVEQLYLVTQKQRMPDVGLVAKDERIQQAEQWLIDSWPKNPGLIEQLLEKRMNDLANRLEKNGLPDIVILSAGQEQGRPRSWLSIK